MPPAMKEAASSYEPVAYLVARKALVKCVFFFLFCFCFVFVFSLPESIRSSIISTGNNQHRGGIPAYIRAVMKNRPIQTVECSRPSRNLQFVLA